MADSTQWGTRRIAAIEKFVVSANVGFLAQGHTHPIGHRTANIARDSGHTSRLLDVRMIGVVIRT